jgi:hypothetical protein
MSGYAQWNPATTYAVNDIVSFDGVLYIALLISINRQPNSNPTYWATTGASSAITSIVAGNGISVSGTTAITVSNNIIGGTGIAITGTSPYVISNTGAPTATGRNSTLRVVNSSTVFGNDTTIPVANALTITLTSALANCNVFTLYIRSISITGNSFSGLPVVSTLYTSDSATGVYDPTQAAIGTFVFTLATTNTFTGSNLIWNVRKAPSGFLYINMSNPTNALTAISNFQITYDILGQLCTDIA